MALIVPLPRSQQAHRDACTHPGLLLDKYAKSYDPTGQPTTKWQEAVQKPTAEDVVARSQQAPHSFDLGAVLNRRSHVLNTLNCELLRCKTIGPLTLHLSRASALENAGICLHPLYGFAYLPGSGLKGMARAYAETIWLPAKLGSEPSETQWNEAMDCLDAVFGFAPHIEPKKEEREKLGPLARQLNDRRRSHHRQRVERRQNTAAIGAIVFHDAWPETWPQLFVDIVNNHHPAYYLHDDNEHPPGDWENPNPVYFLAVKPGVTFSFPLSKRRGDVPDARLQQAREWLLGALCHLGAGAKTVAGYGAFQPVAESVPQLPASRASFETTLELVTPAFLAGANQQAEDCDLRPATLRGLLRWWWRTMHAGFMDVKTLRALEAAIWGDTKGGGAIRIVLERLAGVEPQLYDKCTKASFNEQQKRSEYGIPNEDPRKTTQGLWYVSYGMDETNRRRCYLESARWQLKLVSRPTQFFANCNDASDRAKADRGMTIPAQQVLNQAKAALWLLCHFGGVGAKSRKGFGSMAVERLQDHTLDACRALAHRLRQQLRLGNTFDERRAQSPSLEQLLGPVEIDFLWPSGWNVLDQVGFAYQRFAKKYKHRAEKNALGLPRRIGRPVQGRFDPTPPVTRDSRHAAPIHIHFDGRDGKYTVRVSAFPAAHLPALATSRTFLEDFLKDFGEDLHRRAQLPGQPGPSAGGPQTRASSAPVGPAAVRVKFIGPHEKLPNAFWVQEAGKKRGLLKYGTPPATLPAPDSEIEVYRTNNNPNAPEYRWDRPEPPRESSIKRRN